MDETQLKRIQDKLQLLLRQQQQLQKDNQLLREELSLLQKSNAQYEEQTEKLKQQLDILKFSNTAMSDAEKAQFEKRINAYLKEIDRCIALLSE
ncbi:MAG: hypothetical protein J0H92_01345 [Sphingobacteriales bacterium]|jgi:chromosome segregation ATPase|nr:hypothetical protein [Chitinophagaceae bacterium]MBN8861982.1 hypothetical protein [Sphingobacteriales bacterium]OJW33304.1 MAG: hypothetical protein BGO54_08515 [Sphingobacteriales bacterium 46-32]